MHYVNLTSERSVEARNNPRIHFLQFTAWDLSQNSLILKLTLIYWRRLWEFTIFVWNILKCSSLPHLEEVRDSIWGDDWWHSSFIRRSPSWGFPGFSSAVRQMPGALCTVIGIISLSPFPLADRRDWRDTRFKWHLARNPDRSCWHRHTSVKLFWPQLVTPWTQKK